MSSQPDIASLQRSLLKILRKDVHDFLKGDHASCMRNAERALNVRMSIHALDPKASLYWAIKL